MIETYGLKNVVVFIQTILSFVHVELLLWKEETQAVVGRCSVKEVFLEISQTSLENTCARPATLLKKRLWHRCFHASFVKFLRTPFYTEHLWWLLLKRFLHCLMYRETCQLKKKDVKNLFFKASSKDVKELSWKSHRVIRFWFLLNFLFISTFFDIVASLSIPRVFSSSFSGRPKSSCLDIPRTIIKCNFID